MLGSLLGLGLATAFVHSRLAERAFVPYVIASQTIPIIALAPLIVFALGQSVLSVVVIATYLTFFPVTIAMIRGLRSFDPRALELMRSYGASKTGIYTKLRLPASLPYLFTALKIAATASIVGAIIGEDTGGIEEGLGRVIMTFNQYYITGPGEAVGGDLRRRRARDRVLPRHPRRPRSSCSAAGPGVDAMTDRRPTPAR